MSIGGAASIATTVFAYFSPTKSPYYAVIAFGTGALVMTRFVPVHNWAITFWPVVLVLAASTLLSFLSRPAFTSEEYNNQLKFARSFGISSAVLCLVWVSTAVEPGVVKGAGQGAPKSLENHWYYWVVYAMAIAQILIFLLYIFIFHNYDARQKGKNFIQLSLVIATLLIGASYAASTYRVYDDRPYDYAVVIALAALWSMCALNLGYYLARNFKLAPPADAREMGEPSETESRPGGGS
jgi:magnesium-transporting ATPase (P-type)